MGVVIAEVLRGGVVESSHDGAFVVADAGGRVVLSAGDPESWIFPRSAIKALQAIPLLVSGTADRFGFTKAELALACASHMGTPDHARTAQSMLAKAGRTQACLECGAHWPMSASAERALAASGQEPSALHNNCSGKHAGFVCTAVAAGIDPAGYVRPEHPVMRDVTEALAAVTEVSLQEQSPGMDGCSIPAFRLPLLALATGFARFGTGEKLPDGFAPAVARLREAIRAHPDMVAGPGRFDTEVMAALGEAAFVKVGAEGVYCGALPGLGLGFALKCGDGAARAAEAATAALLRHFLGGYDVLDRLAAPVLRNWNGMEVGRIRGVISDDKKLKS
jgi:L-asparaginase II